jgi:aspartyl-tRNA(Asn)/glutamyl-tRNA(Gln) amidotransferase subunit A
VGLGTTSGLPIGFQIFGRAFDEARILQAGHILEQSLPALPSPAALSDL